MSTETTLTIDGIIELFMDEDIVTDWADEYGEPGYTSEGPILLGDWWCRRPECKDGDLHTIDRHYPAEMAVLNEAGAEMEWYDEWIVIYNDVPKAYRTQPDSYSWQQVWTVTDDGELLTPEDDLDVWVEAFVNKVDQVLPSHIADLTAIAEMGFIKYNGEFRNGWYGVADKPADITAEIREVYPNAEVLFVLDYTAQFEIGWSTFYRLDNDDES